MMKSKRGEMTTQQIVILVILVISFAVLLFFLFRLNLGNETDKEICRNSVVTRGSSIIPTEGVPLECKRAYVCLTEDGSCEAMTKPDKRKVETKEEIYGALAEEMVDCWWMFGEGEVNYVGADVIPGMYCSLCAQIAFDDSVKNILEEGIFDKEEFYRYMALTNMTGQEKTYAEYLFNTNDIDSLSETEFGKIDFQNQYYVLLGMRSDVSTIGYVTIAAAAVGAIAFAPILGGSAGIVTGSLLMAGAGTGAYFVAPVVQSKVGNKMIAPSLIKVNSDEFEGLGCKQIATLS